MRTSLLFMLLLSISIPVYADSYIKCGSSIAHLGDERSDVENSLGDPDYAQEEEVTYLASGLDKSFIEYYYVCGRNLWCLKFDNDILASIRNMGPEKNNRDFIERRFGEE